MWVTAEPVVEEWMQSKLGPEGRIQDAAEGAATLGRLVGGLPELLAGAERTAHIINEMASGGGLKLDRETSEAIAAAQADRGRSGRTALWVGAIALVVIALAMVF
jgi:ubiquinone biosynthesis protein